MKKSDDDNTAPIPLAIVGIGCLFPKANDAAGFWSNIKEGVDAITEVPAGHWDPADYFDEDQNAPDMTYARRGGFIDPYDFDPLLYGMSPNNIEATDTTQLLGMAVARQALLDAGYATGRDTDDGRQFDRDRTSVILGVTGTLELVIPLGARLSHPIWRQALRDAGVDAATAADVVARIAEGYVPWQENSFPGLLGNVAAGRIANRFDLGGTNCVVDAACASSLSAVHMAAMELYAGRADMAITGGFDTFNDIFMYMCFSKTPALSPTGNSRPFDHKGDGTILGEGLGAIVLKRLADARRDGDRVYAVIRGLGSSSDGRGNAIYAPSAEGQQKALRNAYRETDISPGTIELVEAHGTGTKVGDAVEAKALAAVYGEDRPEDTWCALGSIKSMIGHTKAAAGVAGLIKVAMALQNKVLPPTIKVERPLEILAPGQAPVYVNARKRPWVNHSGHPRRAGISAFGFGGSNFHCVLEEAEPAKQAIEWDGKALLFAFSSDSYDQLALRLNDIDSTQTWPQLRRQAALSLQEYDPALKYRLLLVADQTATDVKKLIENARDRLSAGTVDDPWHTPDGAFFGSGHEPGQLAILFPGQGSQYTGMLRDLACQFPHLLDTLQLANSVMGQGRHGERLSDRIYPISVFDDESGQAQEQELRRTVNAQPAIGAVSIGALRILQQFGLKGDAVAGHSFGELSALCCAGVINETDFFKIARKRGELMQQGDGDRGAMLAVVAAAADVDAIMEEEQLDLVIANNNSPKQVILSGAADQIERAAALFSARKITARRLPVAAAFHSSFVADAEKPFAEFLKAVTFQQGAIPVYANTTGATYPQDADPARGLLAGQLARPVAFVEEINNLYDAGLRTFIEVGPGSVLTGLVRAILNDRPHQAVALDASKGSRSGQFDLACLLARLGSLGHQLEITQWDAGYLDGLPAVEDNKKPVLTIPISGANYVKPRPRREPVKPGPVTSAPVNPTDAPRQQAETMIKPISPRTPVPSAQPTQITEALRATQQSILALQKMQEQTAQLHKQYLHGQEQAQQTIRQLIDQQQRLSTGQPLPTLQVSAPVTVPLASMSAPTVAETPAAMTTNAHADTVTTNSEQPTNNQTQYQNVLLDVVAEKTGYPIEMLSLEMSLDTDLGIDSIKRVEILSALQERLPGIQKIQPEQLGTFQLLQHIVEFLADDEVAAASMEATAAEADNRFQLVLLEVVADKTGYPVEMLNLEMDMDNDLGIDSIKRVEILSALQERLPDAPVVSPDELGKLQTLQQIVDYMGGGTEALPVATAAARESMADGVNNRLTSTLLDVVAEKTGYPLEMLNLEMNLDTDLGIDSIKRVEILSAMQERLPRMPAVSPEALGALQTLQQIVDHIHGSEAPATTTVTEKTTAAQAQVDTTTNAGLLQPSLIRPSLIRPSLIRPRLIRHIVEVKALDNGAPRAAIPFSENATLLITDDGTDLPRQLCRALEQRSLKARVITLDAEPDPSVAGLVILAPDAPDDSFIKDAFRLMQQISSSLREAGSGQGACLTAVTRFGGRFGMEGIAGASPLGAGLAGLVKTADKEWPQVSCKVIDISAGISAQLVAAIVDEVTTQGPLEVGINGDQRFTLTLAADSFDEVEAADVKPFTTDDVVVITGGARGVTAGVAVALAQSCQPKLVLIGRSPMPQPQPRWLDGVDDEAGIKKAILANSSERLAPKDIEHEYRGILANREILDTLQRIEAAGAQVLYQSADTRDLEAVSMIIEDARRTLGPISGVIHGAGVLADRLIEDKTPEQFHEVFSTKVDGAGALLKSLIFDDLKLIVMFSSTTGRLGRKGQSDYAAANEVLNKLAQQQREQRPECRVLSINWGPWDGGMVTPQLKKLFESEGVGVIPLRAGAEYLINEITAAGPVATDPVEIVVLGESARQQRVRTAATLERDPPAMQIAFARSLSVAEYPILRSHVMNGKAVLPMALIAEWLAHGAVHNNPGLQFKGFDDLKIYKGVILEGDETINLRIMAGQIHNELDDQHVAVELRSGETLHAGAVIVLGTDYDPAQSVSTDVISGAYPFQDAEYYSNGQLFHGVDLHGIESVSAASAQGISARVKAAPAPANWMQRPVRSAWFADPLVLDSAFQMMILWSFQEQGAGSLPTAIKCYRQYQRGFPKDGAGIIARIVGSGEHSAEAMIEFLDGDGKLVAKIEGYECVTDASLNEAFTRNQLEEQV